MGKAEKETDRCSSLVNAGFVFAGRVTSGRGPGSNGGTRGAVP